jgi:hypothetical protein
MAATYVGRIYRIINDMDDEEYIGSTKQTLSMRMVSHRCCAKKGKVSKLYDKMREHGTEHFSIILIERLDVANKEDLTKREQEVIDERATLNTQKAHTGITRDENYNKNYLKAYREVQEHKDAINEYKRVWRQSEEVKAKETTYNKALNAKNVLDEKYKCCGHVFIRNVELQRHKKSKKHLINSA